jgi:hypothetical protein
MSKATNRSTTTPTVAVMAPEADAFDAAVLGAPATVCLSDEPDLTKLALSQNFAQLAGVKRVITTVPARKPSNQQFIRVRPGTEWSIQALTLSLKDDGEVYFVHPQLYAELAQEVRPKLLYLYVTRDGSVGLWPVNTPGDDGRLDAWSQSAHTAAKLAQTSWIRLVANRTVGAYEVRQAANLTDEPVWPELTMREILNLAFRDKLITSLDHPIIKGLRGEV